MKMLLAAVLTAVILLTGCSPLDNNLDKRLIVQGIGIDISSDEYIATVMYMDTLQPVGEGDVTSSYAVGKGENTAAALAATAEKTGKEPLYGQCSFIVLGASIIETGIEEAIGFFTDYYEFSPGVNIFCCEGSAGEVIQAENMSERLIEDFSTAENSTAKTITPELYEVYSYLNGNKGDTAIARLKLEEKNAVLDGAVAFQGNKHAAVLEQNECMGALLICGEADRAWDSFILESKEINYQLTECKSKTSLTADGFEIAISAKANIYFTDTGKSTESEIESRIKKLCEQAINRILKKNGSDIFELERELYVQNYSLYRSLSNPKQYVRNSDIDVKVDIDLQADI